MLQTASGSTSIIARVLALQAGIAIWFCLFDFLLNAYLSIDESNRMPSASGYKVFDISRFAISAIVSGLFAEAIVVGRNVDSPENVRVWYTCVLFLLPYFHHFVPRDGLLSSIGALVMLYVCAMSQIRVQMIDHSLLGRVFFFVLGIPTLFIVADTLLESFDDRMAGQEFWAGLELPTIYTSQTLAALVFTIHASLQRHWRLAFTSALVGLNAFVWCNAIVKPY